MAIGGAVYLSLIAQGQGEGMAQVPDVITALGSAAIGAMAGLLSPGPTSRAP